MAIVVLFLLGIANFAMHKAVLQSGHALLGRASWFVHMLGGRFSLFVEFLMLLGAMLMARESARHFVQRNTGNIVNVSSTAGRKGFAEGTAYVASKFALGGMTECWRAELRVHNIRVMQINPSEVLTRFSATAGYDQAQSQRKLRAVEIAHAILGMLSMDDRGFTTELTVFATNPDS